MKMHRARPPSAPSPARCRVRLLLACVFDCAALARFLVAAVAGVATDSTAMVAAKRETARPRGLILLTRAGFTETPQLVRGNSNRTSG